MADLDLYPTDVVRPDGVEHRGTRLVLHEGALTVWAVVNGAPCEVWRAQAETPLVSALSPGWPRQIVTTDGPVLVARSSDARCWGCGNPLKNFHPYPGPKTVGV